MAKAKKFLLRIADIGFLVRWKSSSAQMIVNECYRGFVFEGQDIPCAMEGLAHVAEVQVCQSTLARRAQGELIKSFPHFWSLYRCNAGYRMECFHPARKILLSVSAISADFKVIRYFPCALDDKLCREYKVNDQQGTWLMALLLRPLLWYVLVNALSVYGGSLAHGCAVSTDYGGFVFVGESGSGKTTLANLLRKDEGVRILTDETFASLKKRDTYFVYGTPWPGSGRVSSPEKAKLKGICFISHAKHNFLKKIPVKSARKKFMLQSVLDAADKRLVLSTLAHIESLTMRIPCYEFGFVNDESAALFLKRKLFV